MIIIYNTDLSTVHSRHDPEYLNASGRPGRLEAPLVRLVYVPGVVPGYDPATQVLEDSFAADYDLSGLDPERVTPAGTYTQTFTVRAKTQAELDAELASWRATADCSAAQAELAILDEPGLMDAIQGVLDHPDTPESARVAFRRAYRWSRNSPLWDLLGPAVGKTPEQIDDLFRLAQSKEL